VPPHALAAFYLARDSMKQPAGQRFMDADGLPWSGRENFGDTMKTREGGILQGLTLADKRALPGVLRSAPAAAAA